MPFRIKCGIVVQRLHPLAGCMAGCMFVVFCSCRDGLPWLVALPRNSRVPWRLPDGNLAGLRFR